MVRTARLDPEVRRRVKVAAARRDLSVSEYCVRAILRAVGRRRGMAPPRGRRGCPRQRPGRSKTILRFVHEGMAGLG